MHNNQIDDKFRRHFATQLRRVGAVLQLLALAALLGGIHRPAAAAELFLVDEREIYLAIDKLNAMGALPGLYGTTPAPTT